MPAHPNALPDLVCFWDFAAPAGQPRRARGAHDYALREGGEPVPRADEGVFGPHSARLGPGKFFVLPAADCPALDLTERFSLVAWLKRGRKPEVQCEAVAGKWRESSAQRQYGLFLDLRIHQASDNVCGHVSLAGGPTPGYPWCMSAAIGGNYVDYDTWHCVAMSYDGTLVRAWLDGALDPRAGFNPYAYPGPLGSSGAEFTVGGVHRGGEMGNWFAGLLGGLAIYARALSAEELLALAQNIPGLPRAPRTRPPMLV